MAKTTNPGNNEKNYKKKINWREFLNQEQQK